jgi:hypothetical protein
MPYLNIYRPHASLHDPAPAPYCWLSALAGTGAGSAHFPAPVSGAWLAPSARNRFRAMLPGEEMVTRIDATRTDDVKRASALRHGL